MHIIFLILIFSFATSLSSFLLNTTSTAGALHTLSFQQIRPEVCISSLSFTHMKKNKEEYCISNFLLSYCVHKLLPILILISPSDFPIINLFTVLYSAFPLFALCSPTASKEKEKSEVL